MTGPPTAPEQLPGDSMGPVPPSGAVYSTEPGGKEPPPLLDPPPDPPLLLLHATTRAMIEPPARAPAKEREPTRRVMSSSDTKRRVDVTGRARGRECRAHAHLGLVT